MNMISRKYILLGLLFCALITDLIHASGFEAPISQAAQAVGVAIVAGVATAVAIATEIIKPIDPEKDLPQIQIQEKPSLAPPETVSSECQSAPAASKATAKPEDFQTPIWQTAPEKTVSSEIIQNHITIRPAPVIPQPELPTSSSTHTTQATLIAAQKLQLQKQEVQTKQTSTPQTIQQSSSQQKQVSQRASQSTQQISSPAEWDESEEFDTAEEQHCSFTQFHAKKKSHLYTDKFLYERAVHFYFEKIENSSLLKIDPVYQQLKISRKSPANFSVADKETLLLRHESLIKGLHEAHQEIMLLQEQDGGSSNQTSDQHNKNTQPPLDPKDPKDKKNILLEVS